MNATKLRDRCIHDVISVVYKTNCVHVVHTDTTVLHYLARDAIRRLDGYVTKQTGLSPQGILEQ